MEKYFEPNDNLKIKDIDDINSTDLSIAGMYEYTINNDKKLLGTYGLATCIAIIMENEFGKTILCHAGRNFENIIKEIFDNFNKEDKLRVIIIPGLDTYVSLLQQLLFYIKSKFRNYMIDIQIVKLQEYCDEKRNGIEFAYNTLTKEFLKPDYTKILGEGRE